MKFTYSQMRVLSKKDKECSKSNLLKYTELTKARDISDMQPNKIKFSRSVAYLQFLFSAFRIQKLSLTIFRNSKKDNKKII